MDTTAPGRPVVVGVDGSEEAEAALSWAAAAARRRRRSLRVVYAADLGSATLAAGLYPEFTVAASRAAQHILDETLARAHEWAADVHVDAAMTVGHRPSCRARHRTPSFWCWARGAGAASRACC